VPSCAKTQHHPRRRNPRLWRRPEIAVKAALTGHLVLSTLHTNDAPSTISRLMNMGIEPFLVATSVNLICAQRLVRRSVPTARKSWTCRRGVDRLPAILPKRPEDQDLSRQGLLNLQQGRIQRRTGLYEVMEINDELRELILVGASRWS